MTYGDAEMKYTVSVIGEPEENGYPVYMLFTAAAVLPGNSTTASGSICRSTTATV